MAHVPFALLLADDRHSVTMTAEIAELLAPALGLTPFDARHKVRRGAGILARRLAEKSAIGLAKTLCDAGLRSFALPEKMLIAPPRTIRVARLALSERGLSCQVSDRWRPEIPWDCVATIHAYAYAHQRELREDGELRKRGVSVGGITEMSAHARSVQWNISSYEDQFPGFRTMLCIDILCLKPTRLYRLEHRSFQFDCLAERGSHSIENFVLLLKTLKERFSEDRLPARTELMSRPVTELQFYLIDKEEERDNANEWLLQRFGLEDIWEPILPEDLPEDLDGAVEVPDPEP